MNKSELGLTIGIGKPQKPKVQKKRRKSIKKKRLSAYEKNRRKLMNRINYWKRRGYILPDVAVPPTEKQLREQGIKGQDLARETRKLKDTLKKFKKQRYVSVASGEIFEGQGDINESMKYDQALIAYDRFYNDFYDLLMRDIPYGGRNPDATDESRAKQKSLLYYLRQTVNEHGEKAVGKAIAQLDGWVDVLNAMMYGSDIQNEIWPAYDKLVKVMQSVTGHVLTQDELDELEDEAEKYVFDFDY